MSNKQTLPLFPLPVFILPQGITRLRIFEPRYLKMVRIASKENGFVILLSATGAHKVSWGSHVEIINFDQGADDILEIDVKCNSLVNIYQTKMDQDKLAFSGVSKIQHWAEQALQIEQSLESKSLQKLFSANKNFNELYPQTYFNNPYWVTARWLELMPVNLMIKEGFAIEHSFEKAQQFVQSVLAEK